MRPAVLALPVVVALLLASCTHGDDEARPSPSAPTAGTTTTAEPSAPSAPSAPPTAAATAVATPPTTAAPTAGTAPSAPAARPTAAPAPGPAPAPAPDPAPAPEITLPPTSGVFDYQLGGTSPTVRVGGTTRAIDVVARDATATPLSGSYNICYVNGFQTQPGDASMWRKHQDLLLHDKHGDLVVDPDWPDEYVLDPSTAAQRAGILAILGPVVTGCARHGFDAVEIDNLDTWTRFTAIDKAGAHALAAAYVDLAHASGLAIAQKNAAEISRFAHDRLGFDFAVTESCAAWDECAAYTDVYGTHVLQIEYPEALDDADLTFAQVCGLPDRAPLTILRDRDLVPPGKPGHRYSAC
ncbi:endo alpha-1,4 polygalactosaminidase [Cellulomonas persica]|uniref:Glycoside-hydrolase family GH114 TIM-barrel domain-containing protein n=1 Tax=Cellulomonas persica TaxID=76861 RepID=A0A510UUM0_9CELL|nr:endo alpha-1,4 polygalactosaminidase [Cellulomonas persica]GEK18367.1 hypothetical protein CPE01_21000 [Cellulomonas persica]